MAKILDDELKQKLAEGAKAFGKAVVDAGADIAQNTAKKVSEIDMSKVKESVSGAGSFIADKAGSAVNKAKDAAVSVLDQNGDGQVDINDVIIAAAKTPGVYINREKFLRRELMKDFPQDVIDQAVLTTPALAGITPEEIDRIADKVIEAERIKVSGIAAALGIPGGKAMIATIPADIIQYYGYTLRAVQELLYLYGFAEIDSDDSDGLQLDSETTNTIILCLGVMNGVAGANNAIKGLAQAIGKGVEKKLLRMALTKGAFYPFVKSVLKWFGVNLTKDIFADFVKKAIPVVGGVIGGGVTFFAFKPCCNRLKVVLEDTYLSNPNHKASEEEDKIAESILNGDIIEGEFEDISDKQI